MSLWLVLGGLALFVIVGVFRLFIRLDLNHRWFIAACEKILSAGDYERFEKLLRAVPSGPLVSRVVFEAWRSRGRPAPIEPVSFAGYREAEPPAHYVDRLLATVAPSIAAAKREARVAWMWTLPGLTAPYVVAAYHWPPRFEALWLVALGLAALSVVAGVKMRKLEAAIEPAVRQLCPHFERAPQP